MWNVYRANYKSGFFSHFIFYFFYSNLLWKYPYFTSIDLSLTFLVLNTETETIVSLSANIHYFCHHFISSARQWYKISEAFVRRLIKDMKHKFLCLVVDVLCLQISFHSIVFIVLNTLLFLCVSYESSLLALCTHSMYTVFIHLYYFFSSSFSLLHTNIFFSCIIFFIIYVWKNTIRMN